MAADPPPLLPSETEEWEVLSVDPEFDPNVYQVNVTVTVDWVPGDPGRYLWTYEVENLDFDQPAVNVFYLDAWPADIADITETHGFERLFAEMLYWESGHLPPGQTATFTFTTNPRPIEDITAGAFDQLGMYYSTPSSIKGPGEAMVSLAVDTELIPVNANNDNGSPWKDDDHPFIPAVRDFDATNLPQDDPELTKVTVTIAGVFWGDLTVSVSSAIECGTGKAQLWKDKRKQEAFSSQIVFPADPAATVTFYIEGTHESRFMNDVVVDAKYTVNQTTVSATENVTIAPVIHTFTRSIPEPSVNFVNQGPPPNGLKGLVAQSFTPVTPGIEFTADVTNGPLTIKVVQNFRDAVNGENGSAAGAVFVAGSGLANQNHLPNDKYTFPGLDGFNPADPTDAGDLFSSTPNPPNGVTVKFHDSPSTGWPANSDKLDVLDNKYLLRLYLVVRYADGSIYPIAYWDWNVNFYATKNKTDLGVSYIEPASKVSVEGPWARSNADP
ncbi:MAG TPA: hypothetical protein VIL46_15030, partial [Gemmataceae bacterium]